MAKRKSKVLVIYKSGAQITLDVDGLSIRKDGGRLVSATWENASPEPLLFGISEVAAIYEL